jgi:uncharacterized membrane protein YqhA
VIKLAKPDPSEKKGALGVKKILTSTRYIEILAVLGCFFSAITMMIYSSFVALTTIWSVLKGNYLTEGSSKTLAYAFLQVADLYLIGAVLYIIAMGLYELFIDETLDLPNWLEIHSLDDLKDILLGVLVLVMGVFFLGELVKWKGESDLLIGGVAIALVIIALAYFTGQKGQKKRSASSKGEKPNTTSEA